MALNHATIKESFHSQLVSYDAIKYHAQGNIKDALNYYQLCLDNGFKDSRVFINYGSIYKQLGEMDKSINLYN